MDTKSIHKNVTACRISKSPKPKQSKYPLVVKWIFESMVNSHNAVLYNSFKRQTLL